MTAAAWIMLFVFMLFGGFRGLIAWALLMMVFMMLGGCAGTLPESEIDRREYERVEYIQTRFIPAVNDCLARNGALTYNGPASQRMRRILDRSDWNSLHRTETTYFGCTK